MKQAWLLSFIRIPLLFISLMIFFIAFKLFRLPFSFPFLPDVSTIYFTLVNLICLILLHRILKREDRSIKDLIQFRPQYWKRDVLYGFLWVIVLYIPFVIAIMGTMFLLFGADFINSFETVFAGEVEQYYARPNWLVWSAALASLIFPFLNAPTEELLYRGYSQPMFIHHYKKVWLGILIPSIGFSLQHILLAASIEGAIAYAVAFFVWGVGSGVIYYKQKRLFPLIVCHFIVNIAFSVFPIVFLFQS